ncbi:MAG: M14 family zinc carboxypeptidase [Pyrinomonadaceae bacterium]
MADNPAPAFFRCWIPTDPASASVIRHLREQGLLCADHRLRRDDRELVVLTQSEVNLLEEAGVAVENLGELVPHAPTPSSADSADAITTGFVSEYLDAVGIAAAFADLHASFPALTTLTNLPETTTGYDGSEPGLGGAAPVKLFRITNTPALSTKPGLLIVAGLHAREWAPPLAAIEFASQLLNNYDPTSADPDVIAVNALVEGIDIFIVGAANPDGINYSRHDEDLWRKNRRPNAGSPGCPGVDLNRNFSIYWGEAGSSSDPCDYQTYHGPSAFSEAENRNIRHIVEQFPNILAAIDCHSYGEDFLRPQPGGGSYIGSEPVPPADDGIYSALETTMNAAIAAVSPGKVYSTGTTSNHAGTFDEYLYFGHRIFAFELEIGEDFQPPIADALVSVQEAAGAMRALAQETLNLSARFITPASIVQVIDKSGSMITSGYVDATRGNAQRLIDLMSLNDSTAVVSFSGTAATELPLTNITGAGVYAAARAAVAGISFGGSTSIGAGLQLGLTHLPPPGAPRSILLLSDGYQNTDPEVETVLPTVPGGVPVHTIALGLASDQALLQEIADETGGTYFFSPDELGLFEVYNVAHAALADHDMVFGDSVSLPRGDSRSRSRSFTRRIVIDCDVDYADFSIAAHQGDVRLDAELRCLTVPSADLRRLERKMAPGYTLLHLKRPQPGVYELKVSTASAGPVTCALAAYVKSALRLNWGKASGRIEPGQPIHLPVAVVEDGRPVRQLSVSAEALSPATSVSLLARQWRRSLRPPLRKLLCPVTLIKWLARRWQSGKTADESGEEVARAFAVREHLLLTTGRDPFRYDRSNVHLVHPKLARDPNAAIVLSAPTSKTIEGTYNLRLVVQGRTHSGCPFMRAGFRSIRVG